MFAPAEVRSRRGSRPLRSASRSFDPSRSAPQRFAPLRFDSPRFAPLRLVIARSVDVQSAPPRSASARSAPSRCSWLGSPQRGSAHIRMSPPPLVPVLDPLLEDFEMFRVRHCRVTSLASGTLRQAGLAIMPVPLCGTEIGIGGTVTRPPLPHHRTCGSASGGSVD